MKTRSRNYISMLEKIVELEKTSDNFDLFFNFLRSNSKKDFVFRIAFSLLSKRATGGSNFNSAFSNNSYINILGLNEIRKITVIADNFSVSSLESFKAKEIEILDFNTFKKKLEDFFVPKMKKRNEELIYHSKLEKEMKNFKKKVKKVFYLVVSIDDNNYGKFIKKINFIFDNRDKRIIKLDKQGNCNIVIGTSSTTNDFLNTNIREIINNLRKEGREKTKIFLSSTNSPSIAL